MLTAPALIASATATHDRLGGPGTWLLALPPHHIAGVQVLIRSVVAGTTPVEIDVSAGFDVAALPAAVSALMMGSGRKYASLVGVQLAKALAEPAAGAALAQLDAVLLGGGPAPAWVLESAAVAGISVVRSYGMSETAGGCVYDGLPLDGVRVRIDDDDRIVLGGSTLAKGYRNPTTPDPFGEPGWFRTDDIGALDDSGCCGSSAAPTTRSAPGPDGAAAARRGGLEHPSRRGRLRGVRPPRRTAGPTGRGGRRAGRGRRGAHRRRTARAHHPNPDPTAAPREVHIVDEVPRLGIGKVDRRALVQRFSIG